MNAFRIYDPGGINHGKLDRAYLRVCAVWRLACAGIVDHARAVELLAARGVKSNVADIWFRNGKPKRNLFD